MKELPKHILITIIVMALIGLLGGGAWFWTSQQLNQKLEEKSGLEAEVLTLEKKGIYPSTQNKKILEEQKNKLEALNQILKPELQNRMDLFSSVRTTDPATGAGKGLDPDAWKKVFGDKRQELRQLAKEKKVVIPEEFNFGFKSYVLAAPRAEHTRDLGVQLLAVEEIMKLLAASGVDAVLSIKRSMVESPPSASGGGSSTLNDEALNARVLAGPENLYRVVPFEISIKAEPQALIRFLNGLNTSPFLFVTRFVYLENEKNSIPKRSEITNPTSSTANTGNSASGTAVTEIKKNFITIAGQEKVASRIRLDLIDLVPVTTVTAGSPAKAKPKL
jgi:hypothetical protein